MVYESIDNLLERPFEGRVMLQADDPNSKYTDFDNNPTILYPSSDNGLNHAVQLREAMGAKGFIRSGLSSSGDGRRSAEGGLVVDMSYFCGIEVAREDTEVDGTITLSVGAAAKNSRLADELIRANAFLPIGDNPVKSVVSSLLSDLPGYFDRSMGHLRDYVIELDVVTPQGDAMKVGRQDDEFNAILDGDLGGIIKSITFSAVPASKSTIRVKRISFVYTHEDIEVALDLLHHEDISNTMDITLQVYDGAYGLIIASVTVAGRSEDDERINAVLEHFKTRYRQRQGWTEQETEQIVQQVEAQNPAQITALILDGGLSGNPYVDRNFVCTHYNRVVPLDNLNLFRSSFMDDLVHAFGVGGVDTSPDVITSVRLILDSEGNLIANADVFLPRVPTDLDLEFSNFFIHSLGSAIQSKPFDADVRRHRGIAVPDRDLSVLSRLVSEADIRTIPGFGGEIYAPGTQAYEEGRKQYASSSYPDKDSPGGSMHPFLIAYPRPNSDDVAAAISFAKANNKHIVTRSGGHQYSGLSSGGDDTILLSMDLYRGDVQFEEIGNTIYATVGVGMLLTDIAAAFKEKGVTIPHGECPRVGIGGHVQTGGYGHILRSYGLTLDHVHSFKIHLEDGNSTVVDRPLVRDENSLYWAVLGGGPGSFGVLTEITFECIRDQDHLGPDNNGSWGSAKTYFYGKNMFLGAMKEIKRWTEQISEGSADLPADVDMCVTVVNKPGLPGLPAAILLEMVNGNQDGGDGERNRQFLMDAQQRILSHRRFINRQVPFSGYEGYHSLSYMSNKKVRRSGTTEDGREFKEPYLKRVNCTKLPLSDDFVDSFVNLIDRVVKSRTVKLVFQMFLGGGSYASPEVDPPLSSICHRDVTLGIVFDCFYVGNRGRTDAQNFQEEMNELLEEFSGDQEIRMLWGSFGDTNISNDEVRKFYYDDATWNRLQNIKQTVDPEDIFHTEFTIQLP